MKAIDDNEAVAVDISALKVSDEYTFKHSVDVATMSMIVAKRYGFSQQQVYEIGIAGLLHDIGKSQIPNEVLNKAGRLTDEEFTLMKQHSVFGYRILMEKNELSNDIRLGVLQHHEKINGRGYPMGVDMSKISPFARIISVADIYDALDRARYRRDALFYGERNSLPGRDGCGAQQRGKRACGRKQSDLGTEAKSAGT